MANGKWQRADWRILHLGLRGSFFDGARLHFRSCIFRSPSPLSAKPGPQQLLIL